MTTQNIFGYCRVSTQSQSITRQIRNILEAYPMAIIYQEAYTGTKLYERKEFNKLLKRVKNGDTIVFDSVSRMSRNADDGIALYLDLFYKGIILYFLKNTTLILKLINQLYQITFLLLVMMLTTS